MTVVTTATVDGLDLALDDTGQGRPMLLLHGWCSDRATFARQIDHFAPRLRTIAVDLPGHGASAKPERGYSIAFFADTIAGLIDALGLGPQVVLVGHSMGGTIALEMARRRPDAHAAVILLDPAPILPPPPVRASLERSLAAMHTHGIKPTLRMLWEKVMFRPTDPDDLRQEVWRVGQATPDHVVLSAWQAMLDWDGAAALDGCTVPLLYVAAERPQSDPAAIRAAKPGIHWGQTVGAGHFNHVVAAAQANAMMEAFLELEGLV